MVAVEDGTHTRLAHEPFVYNKLPYKEFVSVLVDEDGFNR